MFHLKVQILFNKAKKIVFFSEEQKDDWLTQRKLYGQTVLPTRRW